MQATIYHNITHTQTNQHARQRREERRMGHEKKGKILRIYANIFPRAKHASWKMNFGANGLNQRSLPLLHERANARTACNAFSVCSRQLSNHVSDIIQWDEPPSTVVAQGIWRRQTVRAARWAG